MKFFSKAIFMGRLFFDRKLRHLKSLRKHEINCELVLGGSQLIRWIELTLMIWLALLVSWPAEATGTWRAVAQLAPDNIDTMLLLSDGTVMAASGQPNDGSVGKAWYRLTPDSQGSYVNGHWSALAPMHDSRLYFSSDVLLDGRVFVAGGEFGSGASSAEVYDPLSDAWTLCPSAGQTSFEDSISKILPNGNVLVAPVYPQQAGGTLIFFPASNTWSNGPTLYHGQYQDEASWVKLPDDSILTIDPFGTNSERYLPALNQWVNDGAVPIQIYDNIASELGAAFLLPNGKAFFLGGTGHTALYTPSGSNDPGVWAAGPDIPNAQSAPDAPAAMMANGKLLCAVSPIPFAGHHYPQPTSFYEYDYASNAFTQVSAPRGGSTLDAPPFQERMLDLPDGSVLFSWSDTQLYVYQPDGSMLAAGKPSINSVTRNGDGSYHLTGTLLNGISEGAGYGDDAQMDGNYPLVRITDMSGNVFYARTYNWNRASVMTGNTMVTTEFTLPAGLPLGNYALVAVANGINSDPISFSLDALPITPGTGFDARGFVGGPFNPNGQTFSLTNIGNSALNWKLVNTSAWLSVSLSNGTLLPGGTAATVSVSLNAAATNLPTGTYHATLWFTNISDGVGQSYQFSLEATTAPLVLNGGFETRDFSFWNLADGGSGYDFVDDGSYFPQIMPHSGTRDALLGEPGTLGFLTQTVPTTAGSAYLLSLWLNSPDGVTPNRFLVEWNGGKLFDQINLPALGWTNLQFVVTATNAASALQFGFRDDNSYLGLDDVTVTSIAAPLFQSVTATNGALSFVWSAVAGRVYQVQNTTSLTPASWANSGGPITATGNTAGATDAIGPDPLRFYRVILMR